MADSKIRGGYYIKARVIQESDIATAPPYIREIWDWLLRECNHSDFGTIKRGQCVRTFRDIQNGLCWYVGYRKEAYKKWQCEKSMKWLRERAMVTTTKTTKGMLITIMNYGFYQDPRNYESNNESITRATREQQFTDTIYKKDKECKKEKEKENIKERFEIFRKKYPGKKRGLDTEFENFKKKHKKHSELVDLLLPAIEDQIKIHDNKKRLKLFCPEYKGLAKWVNDKCWEDEEGVIITPTKKSNPFGDKK